MAVLWGKEHQELGQIGTATLGNRGAIAISRGLYPKGYKHTDPNEDAAAIMRIDDMWVLAVADGHGGFDAAEAAIAGVIRAASQPRSEPEKKVRGLFDEARLAVANRLGDGLESRQQSRTALTATIISGPQLATSATLGDSSALIIGRGGTTRLATPGPFLGPYTDMSLLHIASASVGRNDYVIVCTDGLADFLGRDWLEKIVDLTKEHKTPLTIASCAIRAAFAGGAGDNIALAVYRVE